MVKVCLLFWDYLVVRRFVLTAYYKIRFYFCFILLSPLGFCKSKLPFLPFTQTTIYTVYVWAFWGNGMHIVFMRLMISGWIFWCKSGCLFSRAVIRPTIPLWLFCPGGIKAGIGSRKYLFRFFDG